MKKKDTTLITLLIKAQLSLYGSSQKSCFLDKFLQITPILNIMKIQKNLLVSDIRSQLGRERERGGERDRDR